MKKFSDINAEKIKKIKLIVSDFDGVFTDNNVYTSEEGVESIKCSKYDSMGLKILKKINLPIIILSSEKNKTVIERCKKLAINCFAGIDDKGKFLGDYLLKNNLNKFEIMYIGNDINDIPALDYASVKVAVADSHYNYRSKCDYITVALGGRGGIREICDVIERKMNEEAY